MLTILYFLQSWREWVAWLALVWCCCCHCWEGEQRKGPQQHWSQQKLCGCTEIHSAVPRPGLEAHGLSGSCSFLHQSQSYATQPALKHGIKAGRRQRKQACLNTLQKFILCIQINAWSLQTLPTGFWQDSFGWYFCYMNACSQSRHSQCAWLIFCLNGTNRRCCHPISCSPHPALLFAVFFKPSWSPTFTSD